jgi:hypothetical protein
MSRKHGGDENVLVKQLVTAHCYGAIVAVVRDVETDMVVAEVPVVMVNKGTEFLVGFRFEPREFK